jgi:hypothetical protein
LGVSGFEGTRLCPNRDDRFVIDGSAATCESRKRSVHTREQTRAWADKQRRQRKGGTQHDERKKKKKEKENFKKAWKRVQYHIVNDLAIDGRSMDPAVKQRRGSKRLCECEREK